MGHSVKCSAELEMVPDVSFLNHLELQMTVVVHVDHYYQLEIINCIHFSL